MAFPFRKTDAAEPHPNHDTRPRSLLRKTVQGIGWLAATPFGWMGTRRIAHSARFITDLVGVIRSRARRDPRIRTEEGGTFDLAATAISFGLTVKELRERLAMRRRQTALISYASLTFAALFLVTWGWRASLSPWTVARITSATEFLPFCGLFLTFAFYNALLNFQIRVNRAATWREYLATDLPFWPR
jgi:hypothetical protein